jgi:hypothetical protein
VVLVEAGEALDVVARGAVVDRLAAITVTCSASWPP